MRYDKARISGLCHFCGVTFAQNSRWLMRHMCALNAEARRMKNGTLDIATLRERRSRLQRNQEQQRLRTIYGHTYASVLAEATHTPVKIDDFNVDLKGCVELVWPPDLTKAPGLVYPYISKALMSEILSSIQECMGRPDGLVGFHDKDYLGLTKLEGITLLDLLAAAETSQDSVVLHLERPCGVMLIDCHSTQGYHPFSLIIQGEELTEKLHTCRSQQSARG